MLGDEAGWWGGGGQNRRNDETRRLWCVISCSCFHFFAQKWVSVTCAGACPGGALKSTGLFDGPAAFIHYMYESILI